MTVYTGRIAVVILVLLWCCCAAVGVSAAHASAATTSTTTNTPTLVTTAAAATEPSANATLVAAYPNTVEDGNDGEFVAIRFDRPTNVTGWTLTDGKTIAGLPNRTLDGTVGFSMTPENASWHTDAPVYELDGRLLLANAGDELRLKADGKPVDSARYRNAPESRVRDFETNEWRPVGATAFDPVRTDGGTATVFVLPDAPDATVETLEDADDRLLLAGYELTSKRVTDVLVQAAGRGVEVRVLLDGSPVGGMSERQADALDRLEAAGVDVRLLSGAHLRYQHHHPKYAVVDDSALVSTENFKPAGTDGKSSRGWGVVLDDATLADALEAVYEADADWRDAKPWNEYREAREFQPPDPAMGAFETRHPPERVTVESATLLVTPDNAVESLEAKMDAADERILIQQVDIDSRDNRLLRAAIRAADRGVEVRVHLTGAWYAEDANTRLADWLNRYAEREGSNLEARVDDANGYDAIHTKGIIVDETAVVGSLNWRASSKAENREVLIGLRGGDVAAYYAAVFEDDWSDDVETERTVPTGLFGVTAVAIAGGVLVARRLRFVGRDEVVTDWKW